jgi:GNAT superfamily N-acetyltransferase
VAALTYWITQVDGMAHADLLNFMNSLEPAFPPLKSRHLAKGLWWLAQIEDGTVIGFAGLVMMTPFTGVGYLKRGYVLPDHRGHGLQRSFIRKREEIARHIGLTMLATECAAANLASQANLRQEGFEECDPEQPWGAPGSIYFVKRLTA